LHQDTASEVLNWLKQAAQQRHLQFVAASFREDDQFKNILSRLWLQNDIVPYIIRKQDAALQLTLEEQVRDVVSRFDEDNIVRPQLSATHEVQVAELVTYEDYRETASQDDFALLTELTQEDKDIYDTWINENASAFEDVFRQAHVIVIDDPQPSGLIPYIKQANPDAKIIYRSHIQIVGSLASQPGTPQRTTWSFLWE